MSNSENVIIIKDCCDLLEEGNEWLFRQKDKDGILNTAFNHLIPNSSEDEKILYRPYESFTRSSQWRAGRYIGEVSFEIKDGKRNKSVTLRIIPRFGISVLAHMLETVTNYKLPETLTTYANGDHWNSIYQIILKCLWIARFCKADKYGLPRKNVKHIYQGEKVKGRLNIRKSIIPVYTKNELVSEYREKEVDDCIGKIVYKAYCVLAENGMLNLPAQAQDTLNMLYSLYNGNNITVTEQEYKNIQYNSIYIGWKPLVDFSWDIIMKKGYDHHTFVKNNGCSIFFDMAEVWECYVGTVLKDCFKHYTNNNSKFSLFSDFSQKIIPDYISNDYETTSNTAIAVGDAKYMNLAGKTVLHGEQAQSVYYKTIMYMHRFNSKKGFIFYPLENNTSTDPVVTESYRIEGTDSNIIKIGMFLPICENGNELKASMLVNETKLRGEVKEKLQ